MAVLDDSADAEVGFLQAEPSGRPFVGQISQSHDDAESFTPNLHMCMVLYPQGGQELHKEELN